MPWLMAILGAFYLLTQGFDSALRWALDLIKLAPVIYLRDGAMVLVIVLGYVDLSANRRDAIGPFALLTLLLVGCTIGAASGLPSSQVLFGLKVWLPLLLGFLLISSEAGHELDKPRFWLWVWAIMVAGIIANVFVTMPWAGLMLQVGDTAIEGNREWDTSGFNRASGFSRTSFDAATCVLLIAFYLIVRLRSLLGRVVIWVLTGAAVVFTTTKGAVGAMLVATFVMPLVLTIDPAHYHQYKWRRIFAQASVAFLGLFAGAIPLISTQLDTGIIEEGTVEHLLFASFGMRIQITWPNAFALLHDWQFVFGRGIGGIGAAQTYFDLDNFNPADNLFVYLYVTLGLVGAALYLSMVAGSVLIDLASRAGQLGFCVLLFLLVYGTTVCIIESAVALMALGALAALLIGRQRAPSAALQFGVPSYVAGAGANALDDYTRLP